MRKVAGQLRLDIAQYNELASFAQFGSDLDKSSMAQLNRGKRVVEILKQKQYSPLSVPEQVAVIYAGTRGYFDSIKPENVGETESRLLKWLRSSKPEILKALNDAADNFDEDTERKLKGALEEFIKTL